MGRKTSTYRPAMEELEKTYLKDNIAGHVFGNFAFDNFYCKDPHKQREMVSDSIKIWSPYAISNLPSTLDALSVSEALFECFSEKLHPFAFIKKGGELIGDKKPYIEVSMPPEEWLTQIGLYKLLSATDSGMSRFVLMNGIIGLVAFKADFIRTIPEDELPGFLKEASKNLTAVYRNDTLYKLSTKACTFTKIRSEEDVRLLSEYLKATNQEQKYFTVVESWLCMVRARAWKQRSQKKSAMSTE